MATVALVNVSKSFGAVNVLKDLNLEINEGEFIALVGPSGCGKSTLLRMISGLESVSKGNMMIDGKRVNDLGPKERNIAMVFQSYALYPHMTVRDNMGFNLKIAGLPRDEIRRKVEEVSDILNLDAMLDRKPADMSGGQRQRVAMGRALVRQPALFLFDEPLSNLDAKLRVQMREEIKRLHQRVKTTSIYVTHDQIEAMTLADRIVIMHGGDIQQVGTPAELYNNPQNRFVAGFIGSPSMNFVEATKSGDTITLTDGSKIKCAPRAKDFPDGRAYIGIRPENLLLRPDAEATIKLSGVIDLIEPTGAQNHLKIKAGGGDLTVIDNDLVPVNLGDTVSLSVRPKDVHIFDTTERIVRAH